MHGIIVDTFAIKKIFLNLISNFKKLRDLKEECVKFDEKDYKDAFDVLYSLNILIEKYKRYDQTIFHDFALLHISNIYPIVNYFTKV